MGDRGSIYTCKNHPTLRWFDTKPGGRLTFTGAVTAEGLLAEAAYEAGNPMVRLRHYINGKNPYAPELPLDEPFTYERLKDIMRYVFRMEELGYVFECECSAADLIKLPGETYESVHARPKATGEQR